MFIMKLLKKFFLFPVLFLGLGLGCQAAFADAPITISPIAPFQNEVSIGQQAFGTYLVTSKAGTISLAILQGLIISPNIAITADSQCQPTTDVRPLGGKCTLKLRLAPQPATGTINAKIQAKAVGIPTTTDYPIQINLINKKSHVTFTTVPSPHNMVVGDPVQNLDYTIVNDGSTNIAALSFSGFSGSITRVAAPTNNCGTTLNTGASCNIRLAVDAKESDIPKIEQNLTANYDGDVTAPQAISINVSGKPSINFTKLPTPHDMSIGETQNLDYTIENNGSANINTLSFTGFHTPVTREPAPSNNCGSSLAKNASCNIRLVVKPTEHGKIEQNLTAIYDGFSTLPQNFTINVNDLPRITFTQIPTPTPMLLETSPTSQNLDYTIQNVGSADATGLRFDGFSGSVTRGTPPSNNCGTGLARNATCNIRLVATPTSSNLPKINQDLNVHYDESQIVTQNFSVPVYSALMLTPEDVLFTDPEAPSPEIKLTNNNPEAALTNIQYQLANTLHKVQTPTNCTSVSPSDNCTIALNLQSVKAEAYGSGALTITYDIESSGFAGITKQANIVITQPTIALSINKGPAISGNNIVVANQYTPQTVTVTNNGKFSLHPLTIALATLNGVRITNNNCTSMVAPNGGTCTFDLETTEDAQAGASANLTLLANNLTQKTYIVTVEGDRLSMIPDDNEIDKHLTYRAIKVTNNSTTQTATFESVDLTGLGSFENFNVRHCVPGTAGCSYVSTCTVGTSLAPSPGPGNSCLLWLQARSIATPSPSINNDARDIGVSINYNWSSAPAIKATIATAFTINYDQSLYIGGIFTGSGDTPSIPLHNIAKYNGTTYVPLGGIGSSAGLNNKVTAFTLGPDGDLYVGGTFEDTNTGTVLNGIAKFNGDSFSPLGGTDENVGLDFDSCDQNFRHIALATKPGATIADPRFLYIGGCFDKAKNNDEVILNNLANYNTSTNAFLPLGAQGGNFGGVVETTSELPPFVASLAFAPSDPRTLYLGGSFLYSPHSSELNNIASYDTTGDYFSPLLSDGAPGVNSPVLTLAPPTSIERRVFYLGGMFDYSFGGKQLNKIASYDFGTSSFQPIPPSETPGIANGNIYSLVTDRAGLQPLYIGGEFDRSTEDVPLFNIARYKDGDIIHPLADSGLNKPVFALTLDNNNILYVGGMFDTSMDGSPLHYLAKYDLDQNAFFPLGNGLSSESDVRSLFIAPSLTITLPDAITKHKR